MIIDYAKPDSRWKRFWARTRLTRKVLAYLCLGLIIVLFLLNNVHEIQRINFQQRTIRRQHTFFGWVVTQRDINQSVNASDQMGQWELIYDVRMIAIPSTARSHSYGPWYFTILQRSLSMLKSLPPVQQKSLEDELWAAAANHDGDEMRRLYQKVIGLIVINDTQPTTTPTRQPSTP